jgi:probable phosphoglycerate mutase
VIEPTRIFALRHGQTAWNAERRLQGHIDIPLDDTGRWQAQRLAQALAGEDLAAIYSSDLQRALATAQAVAGTTGAPITTDPHLRERAFGRFEGHVYADITRLWPEEAERWRRREPDFPPGGGEALVDFYSRCVTAVSAWAERHPGQAIAVVAHGGVLDCLYRAATGLDLVAPRSWQLGNAAVNRLLYREDGFCLVGWDDAAHLDGFSPSAARGD